MKRLMRLAQLMGMGSILFVGYSNCMQQQYGQYGYGQTMYPQQQQWGTQQVQPVYGSAINVSTQNPFIAGGQLYPSLAQQPSAPTVTIPSQPVGRAIEEQPRKKVSLSEIEQGTASTKDIDPMIIRFMANEAISIWHTYEKAKMIDNVFDVTSWNAMYTKINGMKDKIPYLNDAPLLIDVCIDLFNIFQTEEVYDKEIVWDALYNIITVINKIQDEQKEHYSQGFIQKYSLGSIPYLSITEQPAGFYTMQQAITSPISGAYDWTRSSIGSAISTGWGWATSAAAGVGSGLQAVRQWALPTEAEVTEAKKRLSRINNRIDAMKAKKTLSTKDQEELSNLMKLKSQYESIIRGWKPALAGAAALGAGYLYLKSGK